MKINIFIPEYMKHPLSIMHDLPMGFPIPRVGEFIKVFESVYYWKIIRVDYDMRHGPDVEINLHVERDEE